MKLEFLASGSPDCPLIRLFAFNGQEVSRLKILLRSMSSGSANNEQPGFEQVNACLLYLRAGQSDKGLRTVAPVFLSVSLPSMHGIPWPSWSGRYANRTLRAISGSTSRRASVCFYRMTASGEGSIVCRTTNFTWIGPNRE